MDIVNWVITQTRTLHAYYEANPTVFAAHTFVLTISPIVYKVAKIVAFYRRYRNFQRIIVAEVDPKIHWVALYSFDFLDRLRYFEKPELTPLQIDAEVTARMSEKGSVVVRAGGDIETNPGEKRRIIKEGIISREYETKMHWADEIARDMDELIRSILLVKAALLTVSNTNSLGIAYGPKSMAAQLRLMDLLEAFESSIRYLRSVTFPERRDDREFYKSDFQGLDFRDFGARYRSYLAAAGMGWFWRKISRRSKQVRSTLSLSSGIATDATPEVQKRLVTAFRQRIRNFRDSVGARAQQISSVSP